MAREGFTEEQIGVALRQCGRRHGRAGDLLQARHCGGDVLALEAQVAKPPDGVWRA